MQHFLQLKNLVDTKQLTITFILSLPRTRSTALHIAITQAEEIDGQINEPFANVTDVIAGTSPVLHYAFKPATQARKVRDFDQEVCVRILNRVADLSAKTKKSSIHLVIHDHFSNIMQDEMPLMLSLAQNVILNIRDPHLQFASLVTRVIHDKLITERGAALNASATLNIVHRLENEPADQLSETLSGLISPERIWKLLNKEANTVLMGDDILKAYEIAMEHLVLDIEGIIDNFAYYLPLLSQYKQAYSLNVALVDAEVLVKQPEAVLRGVTEKMVGLTFSQNMIDNWQKGTGDDFHCCVVDGMLNSKMNSWTGPAGRSSGLTLKNDAVDAAPAAHELPKVIQPLLAKAMQEHLRCLSMPELVKP